MKSLKQQMRIRAAHVLAFIQIAAIAAGFLSGCSNGSAGWDFETFLTAEDTADNSITILSDAFTDRLITDQASALAAIGDVADLLDIKDVNAELTDCKVDTVFGNTYYRFYQEYEGIPVHGRSVVVVADEDGEGLSLSGNYIPVLELNTDVTASQEAVDSAIQEYFCERLGVSKIDDLFVEEISASARCIYTLGNYSRLSYRLYAEVPQIGCYEMLVDAQEPKVLYAYSLIQCNYKYKENGKMENISTNGQETVQSIDVYRNPECYIMADVSRNIEVYKMQGDFWWGYSKNTNEIDEISWVSEEELQDYANEVDALANVQIAYDYFVQNLAHHSTDGNGDAAIIIYTDWGFAKNATFKDKPIYLDNAFSDSNTDENWTAICIGLTKDKADNTQSANLDTVAHEYAHAVIKFVCNLGDQDETSAINEGLADIFGELVEAWKNGSCDWVRGNRTIYKPSVNGYAETASDNNNGTEDYAHGHSTVISHAAYLMYTGIGGSSAVEGLSTDDLAHLFYRTLYTLPSDCTFSQFRTLVENMADIMCRQGALTEKQRLCVSNAFAQVGITPAQTACYTVSGDLSLLVYDINGDQYSNYNVTVSSITPVQGPGILSPLTKTTETYAADELLSLDEGKTYQITISDQGDGLDSYTYFLKVRPSGKKELPVYTSFGKADNDASAAYSETTRLTTASERWTDALTMTDDSFDLLDGYWENMIQSYKVYQFFDDGTVIEYDAEPLAEAVPENLSYCRTLRYQWDGKTLVIEGEDFKTILEQVTRASPVEWDTGLSGQLSKIPDGEVFFYETTWVRHESYDNAMYLVKAEEPNGSVLDCYKAVLRQYPESTANTYTVQAETKTYDTYTSYTLYDIDKDGISELIVKRSDYVHYYDIYTCDGNSAVFCGEFYWPYDNCLYEYDGNGLIVYDGGMGTYHFEYILLYTLTDNVLEDVGSIKDTEESSYEEVRNSLEAYTPINDFCLINDDSLLMLEN